ncbi:ACP phosphodiesterase [Bacteroidota bacterium]
MNFLAHSFLSGQNKKIITGNFIADWVKGKKVNSFPEDIKKGITIHRSIDSYTDSHLITKKSKQLLVNDYQKYSGVIIDIFYDHFLANNWSAYSDISLSEFSRNVYLSLVKHYKFLPATVKFFLPNLIATDRLGSYAKISGIQKAIEIMARRTSLPDQTNKAMKILNENYPELQQDFSEFFIDITDYVIKEHNIPLIKYHKPKKN